MSRLSPHGTKRHVPAFQSEGSRVMSFMEQKCLLLWTLQTFPKIHRRPSLCSYDIPRTIKYGLYEASELKSSHPKSQAGGGSRQANADLLRGWKFMVKKQLLMSIVLLIWCNKDCEKWEEPMMQSNKRLDYINCYRNVPMHLVILIVIKSPLGLIGQEML